MKFLICMVAGVLVGLILGLNIQPLSKEEREAQALKPNPPEFVSIGNDINRTDDREMGVSCYRTYNSVSCVMTGVGLEGGPK